MRMPAVVATSINTFDGNEHMLPLPMIDLVITDDYGRLIPATDPFFIGRSVGDFTNAPRTETLYTAAFPSID